MGTLKEEGGNGVLRFLSVEDNRTAQFKSWPQRSQQIWVDVGPEDRARVKEVVRRLYPAHPAAINRVLNGQGRSPSLLVEEKALVFVLSEPPKHLNEPGDALHLGVFLGQNFLVTVHLSRSSPAQEAAWQYILQNDLMREGVDFALYQMAAHHMRLFGQLIRETNRDFEEIHRQVLLKPYKDLTPQILELRRKTSAVRRLMAPEGEIFELLKSPDFPYVQSHNRAYFEDLAAEIKNLADNVNENRDGLSGMVEAYTGMQSNEINKVMKFLTIISVLSLPATMIASIYGMNFVIPETHWRYGYAYSLSLILVVTLVLLGYIWSRDWF